MTCPLCYSTHRTWRAGLWHLLLNHPRTVRRIWDERYGLAVTDPEDACLDDLTEHQCREVIAATLGLPAGTAPQPYAGPRKPHHILCARCERPMVLVARRLCSSCYQTVASAHHLDDWPTEIERRRATA